MVVVGMVSLVLVSFSVVVVVGVVVAAGSCLLSQSHCDVVSPKHETLARYKTTREKNSRHRTTRDYRSHACHPNHATSTFSRGCFRAPNVSY